MATNVKMTWRGDKYSQSVHRELVKAINRAAVKVESTTKKSMVSGAFPGQPSPAGEPPHKQTGELRRSIDFQLSNDKLSARVGPKDLLVYGRVHEFGTKAEGGNLPARPFLRPAFEKCLPWIKQEISKAMQKAGTK